MLKVLLHKHKAIRKALGVSIPVPGATSEVIEALAENVLLAAEAPRQERLDWMDDALRPHGERLDLEWERVRQSEVRRRSLFAQHTIDPDDVAAELEEIRTAVGHGVDVKRFMTGVLETQGAVIRPEHDRSRQKTATVFDLREVPASVRDALVVNRDTVKACFDPPGTERSVIWSRTHPSVSGLAGYVLDTALDPILTNEGIAARCGVMRTRAVSTRTTLLLCRSRMTIATRSRQGRHHMLAEEALLLAFTGSPEQPAWLPDDEAERLLTAAPSGNVAPDAARDFVAEVIAAEASWRPYVHSKAEGRADGLAESHARVRAADRRRGGGHNRGSGRVTVTPQHPTDVLGIYVFLPSIA